MSNNGRTAMAGEESAPVVHGTRRFFVGPMPEKVIPTGTKKRNARFRKGADNEDDDHVTRLIKHNAFDFFVHAGGNPEDWDDDEENHFVRELLSQWHLSEWGKILNRGKNTPQSRWVGGSFEIGNLLGLNILADNLSRVTTRSESSSHHRLTEETRSTAAETTETYFTVPSPAVTSRKTGVGEPPQQPSPSSSNVPLLRPSASQQALRPVIQLPSFTKSEPPPHDPKGKQRAVHYADTVSDSRSRALVRTRSSRPVSPTEVLEREGDQVHATSAGAMTPATPDGEVILRERMFVKILSSKSALSPNFNELQHRTTRGLQFEDQGEFMVVWRQQKIELYNDYKIPGREWVAGHKNLEYRISLRPESEGRPSKTKLSMYSFVDSTFCLISPPTPTLASRITPFNHDDETIVFIFKTKCRSRAFDWVWKLWRHLGGELPPTIEIWNPALGTKVKIDIPALDVAQLYPMFTRQNVIALCLNNLRAVANYKTLLADQLNAGNTVELAWRMDTILDWIWLEDDVFDEPRKWCVLYGFAVRNGRPLHLELRLAQHFPDHLSSRDGTRLDEPPGVEGYLDRIRAGSQAKQQVYLATHNGNLFFLAPSKAFPPTPFGTRSADEDDLDNLGEKLRQSEVKRGASQILGASHVLDLRDILIVRRAFQPFVVQRHSERESHHQDVSLLNVASQSEDQTASDEDDEGGDDGLAKSTDKPQLKMKRSFELLLKNGQILRFEAHSRKVALEWIDRLRGLIRYWKYRHGIDAREEMDAAQSRRPRLTPNTHVHRQDEYPEPPADPSAPLPALSALFNRCVILGCKPIVRGGKIYTRKGLYGQYQMVQMFLIPGYLVHFAINPKSTLHQSMNRTISLVDAYLCSGYFAAQMLPSGQYNANGGAVPRRYQDGLETDDPEEDVLFIIWYRSHTVPSDITDDKVPADGVPRLSSSKKLLVCRTRNKLERDAWCWALNCEIEKVARRQQEREVRIRDNGGLVNR